MTRTITYYAETPAIRELEDRYGSRLDGITPADRFRMIEALASACTCALVSGESNLETLIIFSAFDDPAIADYLVALDHELPNCALAAQFILGLAEGLTHERL